MEEWGEKYPDQFDELGRYGTSEFLKNIKVCRKEID